MRIFILLSLAVTLASGCRAPPGHLDPFPALPGAVEGLPLLRLAVTPVVMAYRVQPPELNSARGFRPAPDTMLVRDLLCQQLLQSGHFGSVEILGDQAAVDLYAEPWLESDAAGSAQDGLTPEQRVRREFLAQARKANVHKLVELRLNRVRVAFEARNDLFWVSFVLWELFVFPSWWVRDETYVAAVRADLIIFDVPSGRLERQESIRLEVFRDFNDFERGFWHLLDILRAPQCLDPEDWLLIAEVLRKPLAQRLAGEAALRVLVPSGS